MHELLWQARMWAACSSACPRITPRNRDNAGLASDRALGNTFARMSAHGSALHVRKPYVHNCMAPCAGLCTTVRY